MTLHLDNAPPEELNVGAGESVQNNIVKTTKLFKNVFLR